MTLDPGLQEAVERVERGESEGLIIHVAAIQEIRPEEWDELMERGFRVGLFYRDDS